MTSLKSLVHQEGRNQNSLISFCFTCECLFLIKQVTVDQLYVRTYSLITNKIYYYIIMFKIHKVAVDCFEQTEVNTEALMQCIYLHWNAGDQLCLGTSVYVSPMHQNLPEETQERARRGLMWVLLWL